MINGVNNNEDIKIAVIGVGGGGGNAVNNMIDAAQGTSQIKFVVVNTDGQDIEKSKAENRILITTKNKNNAGLGAGAKPEVGADAAENCLEVIAKELEGQNLCFISAGLGGGTGTGAAPVIADFAKNQKGITTVAVVTRPFSWEGKKRAVNADAGLTKLLAATDALIEIPNDRVVDMSSKKTSLTEAFKAADNVLRDGVLGITDLITKTGIINLDFADVQAIVKEAGKCHMGIGTYSASGEDENPVINALHAAIDSPLLETSINGAKRIMINYASRDELSMLDIVEANKLVYDKADEDVNLIWGAATDNSLPEGQVKVTVIAAEFNAVVEDNVNHNYSVSAPMQQATMSAPQERVVTQNSGIGSLAGNVESNQFGNYGLRGMSYEPQQTHRQFDTPVETRNTTPSVPKTFDANKFKSLFSRKN